MMLIGFVGVFWMVVIYMVEGGGLKDWFKIWVVVYD